ncbi:hypothetical protein [Halobacterium sp. R2-5]|uniref:hypothetical protein n=1 Tax=Halobacterium sp. R2-5 TaxID=2715751 RepID=UPI0014212DB8|nr:hypothetical protein [Halobacterium sp. R2-5]NIB99455.1 hypothetical protein [Halobacterium sp. R2-5]
MTFSDFLEEARTDYEKYGFESFKFTAQELFHGLLSRGGYWVNYGDNFYDYEWDLLILLDACRWDLMEEVVDEYDFVEAHDNFMGHSSHSREWLHKTFMQNDNSGVGKLQVWKEIMQDPDNIDIFKEHYSMKETEEIDETAYITWNFFAEMLDGDQFDEYVPVGRAKWGDGTGILDPREITDRTIEVMREHSPERTIAHYMQPHTPLRKEAEPDVSGSVWERIQRGEKDYDEAWSEYKDNLRWVMDDVELLLENVDAETVVISADHGNVIGEWGCYGHRPYAPIPAVKRVPWIEATANDEGTYEPEIDDKEEANQEEIEDRLEALGYK